MPLILNGIYVVLLIAASPWLVFNAWRKNKYREGYAAKLLGHAPIREGDRRCIWFHAASAGEVNLLVTIIAKLQRREPETDVFVSSTTKTGYDLAQQKLSDCTVFYCPLDFSWAVGAAMKRVRPDVLVLSELELWPNLIWSAKRHGATVALINGRLSEKSFRGYGRIRPLVASMLRSIDVIAAQNQEYAGRFIELGATRDSVTATGSMKFDGAQINRSNVETLRLAMLSGITEDDVVFLAGSTQAPEEQLALQTYQELAAEYPELRLILVPRHPERFEEVARILDDSEVAWQRRSELDGTRNSNARVLLVDVMGELGAWWGTAHIAYVGGSMGSRGGQNMIEPAGYGAAVSFGPETRNFRDIVQLMLTREAAVVVHDQPEMKEFVDRCLTDWDFASDLGQNAQDLVHEHRGATDETLELIITQLNGQRSKRRAA